jgi:pSer/pThr/pTyr-binding forkhead associated (FHA) protein
MAGEQLLVSEGKARGARLTVEGDLLIGRAVAEDEAALSEDPQISRRHARVSRGPGGRLTIEDLGSANGTFVNGDRLDAPRPLEAGDVIRVGQTLLEVTDASGRVPEPREEQPATPSEPTATATEELSVTDGADRGRRLTLGDELVIGRGVGGDGRLGDDPEVSRRHARVARDVDGRLTVEDLGSANGTFLNDLPVRERQVLNVGDYLRVGRTTLQLTVAGQPSAPPARQPSPAPEPVLATENVPAALALGSVFAGCRIEEIIGHGDMGVVYRAEELALQRPVALKLIRPEHSQDERFRERFRRESMVAASIDHPNVIPIFEAGDEDGVLFISMRLVEGTDLRALIAAEGRLEGHRAARIVRRVGAALDAAHAHGLVHRDIKPANVLLARADHVYLSDFGLAKRAGDIGGLTRKESLIARAEYVAPEQIVSDRTDALTDVYALGCLLYESLTGEAPFAASREGRAILAHVEEPPPSLAERRPDLPREFDDVVRRAMAKEPNERYPSAGDLGEAALVAAGELRRARAESLVATGEAAPSAPGRAGAPSAPGPAGAPPSPGAPAPAAESGGTDADRAWDRRVALRWGLALAILAVLAVCMVAVLGALAKL